MTARGPGRPAAASPALRVLDAPGGPAGTCLACGRRCGLVDMIDHAGRHMRAAPGAGKAGRSALLLLTGGGPAAGAAWVLAQVWDRYTLADLSGFIECEWLGRRVDVRAAIARTAGTALLDMTASVAGMFTKVADLELDTDTEYSPRPVRRAGAPPRCQRRGVGPGGVAHRAGHSIRRAGRPAASCSPRNSPYARSRGGGGRARRPARPHAAGALRPFPRAARGRALLRGAPPCGPPGRPAWQGAVPLNVSIVIPVYNAERYLDECIQSALNQTYPHTEIIAVDDGSTDSSPEILKGYADRARPKSIFSAVWLGLGVQTGRL